MFFLNQEINSATTSNLESKRKPRIKEHEHQTYRKKKREHHQIKEQRNFEEHEHQPNNSSTPKPNHNQRNFKYHNKLITQKTKRNFEMWNSQQTPKPNLQQTPNPKCLETIIDQTNKPCNPNQRTQSNPAPTNISFSKPKSDQTQSNPPIITDQCQREIPDPSKPNTHHLFLKTQIQRES